MGDIPNKQAIIAHLGRGLAPADQQRIAQALGNLSDPAAFNRIVGEIQYNTDAARRHGLGLSDFVDISDAARSPEMHDGGVRDWQQLVGGSDPRAVRAALSEHGAQEIANQGGDALTPSPAMDLANGINSRDLTGKPDPSYTPSVTDFGRQLWDTGAGAVNHLGASLPSANAEALPGTPASPSWKAILPAAGAQLGALAGNGVFQNPLSALARSSLSYGTQGGTQGLGVAYPNSGEIQNPEDEGALTNFGNATTQHDRGGLAALANKYGVRVGGYGDPAVMLDAMKPSIEARRQADLAAGKSPEEAQRTADEATSKFNTLMTSEGGVDGLRKSWHDAAVDATAGTPGNEGIVDSGYRSGLTSNLYTPAAVADAQARSFGRLNGFAAPPPQFGPAPPPRPGVLKSLGTPQIIPAVGGRAWDVAKKWGLPALGSLGSMAMSLPSYLASARNQGNAYDTAADPTGAQDNDLAHNAASGGTKAGALGLQFLGGEAEIPRAIAQGAAGFAGGLQGTTLGAQLAAKLPQAAAPAATWLGRAGQTLASPIRSLRNLPGAVNAIRAAGAGASAGGLLGAGVSGVAKAAPAFALGSAAIDAGQNVGAATRSMQSLISGDPYALQTVTDENKAMANNAGWANGNNGFLGNVGAASGMLLRPTSATREILGAKDQINDAQQDADARTGDVATRQAVAPIQQLNKYRAQVAANGGDTAAIDAQLRRVSSAPGAQAWGDIGKWQNGMTGWAANPWGDHRSRGELPFAEQYGKMDEATRTNADAIMKGVAEGTVDPERARVALGIPAMANWSSNQQNDPQRGADYTAMNQRHVLEHANAAKGGYQPYAQAPAGVQPTWQPSGQWQSPSALKPSPGPARPLPMPSAASAPAPMAATPPAPAPPPTALPHPGLPLQAAGPSYHGASI